MTTTQRREIRPAGAPMVAEQAPPRDSDQARGSLVDDARGAADRAAGQAREIAGERVSDLSSQLGRRATDLADDLRAVADGLEGRDRSSGARLAKEAGEQTDRVGRYLSDADMDRLAADARWAVQHHPLAVAGGVIATGAVLGRLIRAAAEAPANGGTR